MKLTHEELIKQGLASPRHRSKPSKQEKIRPYHVGDVVYCSAHGYKQESAMIKVLIVDCMEDWVERTVYFGIVQGSSHPKRDHEIGHLIKIGDGWFSDRIEGKDSKGFDIACATRKDKK